MIAVARIQNTLKYLHSCVVRQRDVAEFMRLFEDTTNKITTSSDTKRFKPECNESDGSVSIVWEDVLQYVRDNYDVAPHDLSPKEVYSMRLERNYVPVVQRGVAHSYEDRLVNMSSAKKEKLQHNKLKGATSSAEGSNFFEKMQREGSKRD